MTKYNIFNEGIKDLPLLARIRHHVGMFIMKIRLEWDCILYNWRNKMWKLINILLTIAVIVSGIIDYNKGLNPSWWFYFFILGYVLFLEIKEALE